MTAPKLDEVRLRELAEAATPGEWIAIPDEDNEFSVAAIRPDLAATGDKEWVADVWSTANAPFIAAANPVTILALLDALSAERERGDRAVAVIERLASCEAFETSMVIDGKLAPEMRARMIYAENFLATQKAEGAGNAP